MFTFHGQLHSRQEYSVNWIEQIAAGAMPLPASHSESLDEVVRDILFVNDEECKNSQWAPSSKKIMHWVQCHMKNALQIF